VYLTFDDGPIPEATPWVLDTLDSCGAKATFFMVGDNARRYPELVREVLRRGHRIGNHTMHHLQGARVTTRTYLHDVAEAQRYLEPGVQGREFRDESSRTRDEGKPLFRPPHGWLRPRQARALKRSYRIVMYDLVSRDYSRLQDAGQVLANVKRYARPGAIIVFHDSLKSIGKLHAILPEAIHWLRGEGYNFRLL